MQRLAEAAAAMWEDDHYVLLLAPQCPATWDLPATASHSANVLRLGDLLHVAEDAWATLIVRSVERNASNGSWWVDGHRRRRAVLPRSCLQTAAEL